MNLSFKTLNNITGWLVFGIAAIVLSMAAERTGSLWDCGEFISGAYKLQVVHPPGAPIFLMVGRLFAWIGSLFSDNPSDIAFAVNLLSALCTAAAALFVCWSTTILARLALDGRGHEPVGGHAFAVAGAGLVAGLTTAFTTSIWFSAVEGEVYAMSTFFTAMTLWAVLKWYNLPDTADADRWLVFAFYSTALSIGVHLLSLLTFPALAMFYYFKKAKKPTVWGTLLAAGVGVVFIVAIQKLIIAGIPEFWAFFDKMMVNSFGLPFYSGIVPVLLIFGGAIWFGLQRAKKAGNGLLQRLIVGLGLVVIAYFSYGMVIIRATANPPINMNDPSDPMRLLPYLNREQYGERPLLRGPHFDAKQKDIVEFKSEPRYGRVGDRYEEVDEKMDVVYSQRVQTLFPRMGDNTQGRPALYRRWIDKPSGDPTLGDNIEFFWKYQLGWMYWRYFMWNFAGRQNGEQGYFSWDPSAGNWISGFDFIDEGRLGNQKELPDFQKNNQARNKYYLIPFLLGLLGLFFHYQRRPRDFAAIMALFIITGIGIIVYSNQPPNEPRERDYVLAASFFTYAIWIGLSVLAIFDLLTKRLRLSETLGSGAATLLALSAPLLMVTQNWDDHSRHEHYASRDYASNFLNSCEPNSIVFTYGDNDTYPLWYCQEVEGIRTDVRVVNLSLIAVDWYINQLRRAVNNSPAIELSIPQEKIRGYKRVQIPFYSPNDAPEREMPLAQVLKFLGDDHKLPTQGGRDFDSYLPTRKISIPVNKAEMIANKLISPNDSLIADTMHFDLGNDKAYLIKDELAILDIINSNFSKRPIYWAVTCREDKLLGLSDYLQLEGLTLRLVPKRTPGAMDAYGIIGSGGVDTETAYKNIMEKWRWGNFDQKRLFVDRSYMPSLQTMRVVFIRLARQLVVEGKKDKAIALVDKYFEVFPEYNFPYDQFSAFLADVYFRAGANDKAAAKIREIAKTIAQSLRYYESLSPDFQKGYKQENDFALGTAQTLMRMADDLKDEALKKDLQETLGAYLPNRPQLPGVQGVPQ
ncbi:MAG: DUF2723 domain-containing protein [Haliscomenobacteraceae bacterium CHB4]|nr:DUF2723 domain-containing protein [Haliscomenobacteraceae bacterium CHB4]